MALLPKITRFRAYQLGTAGSSFSYFNGGKFTLIEARYNNMNAPNIEAEMEACGVESISTLHITSWDQDHCVATQLEEIIKKLKPNKIEYPGYTPHTESGESSLKVIEEFKKKLKMVQITPKYIAGLKIAETYGYTDLLYHPKSLSTSSNDNSTVKLFRSGSFNVLSLGDVESAEISSKLTSYSSVKHEIDVMILAHHGASNGFTTHKFLNAVRPSIAIASADYANQFQHPKKEIRDLLHQNKIQLFTTKTGDVLIYSIGAHTGRYRLDNLMAESSEISSSYDFRAKKMSYLNVNADTLRAKLRKR
jgi:competence protein ComEC